MYVNTNRNIKKKKNKKQNGIETKNKLNTNFKITISLKKFKLLKLIYINYFKCYL